MVAAVGVRRAAADASICGPADRVNITLVHLRTGLPHDALAVAFDVDPGRALVTVLETYAHICQAQHGGDVAAPELAGFCLNALRAAASLTSKAALSRLVAVTLAGLRPPA